MPRLRAWHDHPVPLTRAASISGFADLVSSLGGDPVGLLGASSVPLTALEAPDSLVPLEACADLLERSAAELHCPDLGLRLAQSQGLHGLGSMALAIRHSETMGKAFTVARRFLALHNQGSTLSMEPDPYARRGVVALRHVWHLDAVAYPQAADKALANLHTVVAALADGDYGLRSIEISYRSPHRRPAIGECSAASTYAPVVRSLHCGYRPSCSGVRSRVLSPRCAPPRWPTWTAPLNRSGSS